MNQSQTSTSAIPLKPATLPLSGIGAWAAQVGLVAAAIVLPAIAHLAGLPVRWLLPMHWPAILAGILYGWRGGLIVGLLSPVSNYIITGYPLPPVLPAMTLEIATYGFVTGWLRERHLWNGFSATGMAALLGRAVFVATVFLTTGYQGAFGAYLFAALLPGFAAGVLQVGVMGFVGLHRDKSVG